MLISIFAINRAQASDDPIRGRQVGRTLAPAMKDEQLMPDQHGFGDNGTESTRSRHSCDDQMNEYDSEVAHSGNGINTAKPAHSGQFDNSQ
jgi:hypothetical protein